MMRSRRISLGIGLLLAGVAFLLSGWFVTGSSTSLNSNHSSSVARVLRRAQGQPAIHPDFTRSRIAKSYEDLPLSFEPNSGQIDPRVKFLARTAAFSLFLTGDGAVFSFSDGRSQSGVSPASLKTGALPPFAPKALASPRQIATVNMRLKGANRHAQIEGIDPLPGTASYFIGSDRNNWHAGIPTYGKVRLRRLYPGVDLIYYGSHRELECDLVVDPDANPKLIQLAFDGADRIEIDAAGDTVIHAGRGRIVLHRPVAYQGSGPARKTVDSHYRIVDGSTVAVEIGRYDRSKPLIIDPVINYASYLGGSLIDAAAGIAVDSSGDPYLTGFTCSSDFPIAPKPGALQPNPGGSCDAFISKFSKDGTTLLFSTYLGGSGVDLGTSIAVDGSGAAYVAGSTSGNFPVTTGSAQTEFGGATDAFIAKVSSDGTSLLYATYLGGESLDVAYGIAIPQGCASNCDAFVAGQTASFELPTTPNVFQPENGGSTDPFDGFVARLNATGSTFKYVSYLGGPEGDAALAIAADSSGNAYVTGVTDQARQPNFPVTEGAAQTGFGGTADAFITKINPTATAPLIYSTLLGGSGYDQATGVAIDSLGDAFVSGITYSTNLPFVSQMAVQPAFGGFSDGFIAEVGTNGSAFLYVTYLGGAFADGDNAIALDSNDDAYVAGFSSFNDVPTVNPVQSPSAPSGDLLVSTDGGITYQPSGLPAADGSLSALAVDINTVDSPGPLPNRIYAGTFRNGLFRSTDGGVTFAATSITSSVDFDSIAVDPTTAAHNVYVGSPTGLFRSTDLGVTFASALSGNIGAVFVDRLIAPSKLYVAAGFGLSTSTDGGSTFDNLETPAGQTYSIATDDNASPPIIYLGTNEGIFASTDGGFTFVKTSMNFQPAFAIAVDSSVVPSQLYAGDLQNGLLVSTDGFASFTIPLGPTSGSVYDIALDTSTSPAIVLVANQPNFGGQVLRSTDAGVTFGPTSIAGNIPLVTRLAVEQLAGRPTNVFASAFNEVDATVSELNPTATALLFSSYLGGTSEDLPTGIAVDSSQNIYLAGGTFSGNFPVTTGAAQTTLAGSLNAFVARIGAQTPTPTATPTPTPTPTPTATPTPASTSTSTPTATPFSTSSPTPASTPTTSSAPPPTSTPTPSSIDKISPTAANVTASPGQTVGGGTFTVINRSDLTQTINSVTVSFSDPSLFSSATLSGVASDSSAQATATPPTASTVFAFQSPLIVPGGTTATFSLKVKIAKSATTAMLSGSGAPAELATVVTWNVGASAAAAKFGALPAGLMLVGLMLMPLGVTRRRRMTMLACALILSAVTAAGCDPCPSCAMMSSTQEVTAISATVGEGTRVKFSGLPAPLGTISVST